MAPCGERRPGGLAVRAAGVPAGWPTLLLSRALRSSAVDSRTGAKVAIKKLYRPFQSELFAKRAYRELRLLKHMRHENVSALGRRSDTAPWRLASARFLPRSRAWPGPEGSASHPAAFASPKRGLLPLL